MFLSAVREKGREGGTTRGQGEVMWQQAGATRCREGDVSRGRQEAMQQPAGERAKQ